MAKTVKKDIKLGKVQLDPNIILNEKYHKIPGQIPYFITVESVLQKEKRLKLTLQRLQMELKEGSPLDVSYANIIMKLIGLPEEMDMPVGQNWDPYYNDYTGMIYGDQDIEKTLKKWAKQLKDIQVPYNPKANKSLITKFFAQEAELFQAVQALGATESGPFSELISDWNLAYAVLGQGESDDLNTALQQVVEQGGDSAQLVKTYVK
jgi:hypothetical protein